MECREVRDYYSDYLENAPEGADSAVKEHLNCCKGCRDEIANLHALVGILKGLPEVKPPPGLIVGINEKIDILEQGFIKRFFTDIVGFGNWSKAVAMAATVTLVFLGAFYFTGQLEEKKVAEKTDTYKVEDVLARADAVSVRESREAPAPVAVSRPGIMLERGPSVERRAAEGRSRRMVGSPVRSVSFETGGGERRISSGGRDSSYEKLEYRTLGGTPGSPRAPIVSASSKSKTAHFVDYVVLIRTEKKKDTYDKVKMLVQSSKGRQLPYKKEALFVQIPIERTGNFLRTLKSIDETTVIQGPVGRLDRNVAYIIVKVVPKIDPASSKARATYFDKIVLIDSEDKKDVYEQTKSLAQTFDGQTLPYGDNVLFAQIQIELSDNFLQALESLGDTTVIDGPLERLDANHFLYIIITVSIDP